MAMTLRTMCDAETGRVIVPRLEIADTMWKRTVGLIGRIFLQPDSGLWLEPCSGIHTFGMRFPIDVLFLSKEMRVLCLFKHVRASRFCGPIWRARTAVELPAGTIEAKSVEVGKVYVVGQ